MSTETKSNLVKMKSSSGIRDPKTKFDSSVIKNRVVSTKQSIDSKNKYSSTTTTTNSTNVSKIEVKFPLLILLLFLLVFMLNYIEK